MIMRQAEAPLLPLDEWRRIMGLHPWHFWQLANDTTLKVNGACSSLVYQYAWQNVNSVGRSEIIDAILVAEEKLRLALGYAVAPQYRTDELPFPEHYDQRLGFMSSADPKGRWIAVPLPQFHVQAIGALELTSIGNASVVLSDDDGDGVNDTFTLSIATSVTDPSEIAVYFASGDRFDGSAASDRWRIQPITVRIAAGTATIKGRAWTIVRPVKHEGTAQNYHDPASVDVLASVLEVCRRRPAPDQHGALVWETMPDGCIADPSLTSNDPAGNTTQPVRYQVRDGVRGWVAGEAASYSSTSQLWSAAGWAVNAPPNKVRINYVSGYPLTNGEMPEWLKVLVARFASAELGRMPCGCESANGNVAHWQTDLSRQGGDESYFVAQDDLRNPFGTRRGHVDAWREIQRRELTLYRGVAAV